MINRLIEWSLKNRFLVVCGVLFLIAWGVRAVYRTPVDAIPDLSENQVIVFADWMGRSPQEVEDQVTYPLSVNLQGLAGVKTVRAASMFGFSLVTIIFEDRIDNYFARTRVLERLNLLASQLPAGVVPQLGPDATGLGWVYQYYLDVDPAQAPGGGYDLGQLRAVQDWFIRYQLNAVQGVAEVGSIGGFVRQYQIEVSSTKMRAAKVMLKDVMEAIERSNLNVGGKVIEENGMEFVVRGLGLVNSISDLEKVVLMERDGTPIYLRDVATIQIGGDFRRGTLDLNGREVVGGTVVMRTGENAREVIERVKEKIAQISHSLPPGVTIKPFYDRSDLIERTIGTLKHALWEEIILVTLAHIIFLWHFRSILIVTLPLPVSILISFILMKEFGITSNIMSLTGIAIAIGVLVDAAIVMTENIIRHCELAEEEKVKKVNSRSVNSEPAAGTPESLPPHTDSLTTDSLTTDSLTTDSLTTDSLITDSLITDSLITQSTRLTPTETLQVVLTASKQVGRPIFFAMAIIILAFVPVFSLTGQEGKLFHPLAFTKTFAMIGSTLLAVTIVPVLASILVRGPFHSEDRNWLMRVLLRIYDPLLDWALRWRKTVMLGAGLLLASALLLAFGLPRPIRENLETLSPKLGTLARGMGSEFMPPLNEGSLLFMPVLLPSTSLTEVKRIMSWQDKVMSQVPEVLSVAGKLGRAETATDPAPVEMIETTIILKPEYLTTNKTLLGFISWPTVVRNPEWRDGMTKEKLVAELSEKLTQVPGYVPGFLQPIENRILMLATGIRAQLGVKILGDNLDELQKKAFEVERIVRSVPGAIGVAPSRVQGKPYLEVEVDRTAMARFGLSAQDVLEVVEAGLGGKNLTTTIEGRQRFPIQVRLERHERDDIERLGEVLVATPSGKFIPLGQVAKIRRNTGPSEIASENGRLRLYVQANVQDRDLGGFVNEVRERIDREVKLENGMTIEYSGAYENQLRAQRTLTLIVPTVLLIIFLLLYIVYHSAKEAAHVILAVPFALTGGVFLQYALGYNFSVAVWVGYIALFGTAIQTGVVMVVYLEERLKKKQDECAAAGKPFTRADLILAVKDGARLRLRPKVMTVATIVASLLPIMWSNRTGSEVMQPLATPVIGGMISSLVHILIVTPVIFAWLRERELKQTAKTKLAPAMSAHYRVCRIEQHIVPPKQIASLIGGALVIFTLVIAITSSTYVVEPGTRGVEVTLGKVSPVFKPEGFGMKIPFITTITPQIIRQQTAKMKADCYSSDLQQVQIDLRVLYRVPDASVVAVFRDYDGDPFETLIKPRVAESINEATAQRSAELIVQKREEIKTRVLELARKKVGDVLILEDVVVENIGLSRMLENAIESKMVQEQEAARARFTKQQTQTEANTVVIKARGEAESINLRGKALRENPSIIDLQIVERWDGITPLVVGPSASGASMLLPLGDFSPKATTKESAKEQQ